MVLWLGERVAPVQSVVRRSGRRAPRAATVLSRIVNVLVICPHYAPDEAPTGEVMTSIVDGLAARGHRLHVVTALPWYREHRVADGWTGRLVRRETTSWGWITRLHPFPTDKSNIPARAVAFGGFTMLAALAAMRRPQRGFRPDVVLVMSPPLILGLAGWWSALRWRVPMVFNIQDVFPDVAVEVGAITDRRVIAVASWLERFLYRRSAAVTVLSSDLRENLADKLAGHRPERVEVIPNFVDTTRVTPLPRRNAYRDEFGLGDRVVVMYAGNLGYSQSVDLMLDAARGMADQPDVVFVINGSGSARGELVARGAGLANVVWVGMQPKERLPEVLAAADVHTVLLKAGLARSSVPSKTYSILASGRPVVASVDPGTEVERVLTESGAGVAVPPEDTEAFVAAVGAVCRSATDRERMGSAGRRWVERWLSPAAVAESYEELFERVRGTTAGRVRRRS
jgi:colanic acid biosynthesis glycosyl transferase WcaI